MLQIRTMILLVVLTLPNEALAQSRPSSVNECTLIQDPIELRNCILRYEGSQTQLPTTIESNSTSGNKIAPAAEPTAEGSDEITEVVKPASPTNDRHSRPKSSKTNSMNNKTAQSTTPPPPQPNPKDTLTHIEQIDISKSK